MNKHPLVQLLDTIQGPCPVARSLESELVVLAVESELIASLPKRGWGEIGLEWSYGDMVGILGPHYTIMIHGWGSIHGSHMVGIFFWDE